MYGDEHGIRTWTSTGDGSWGSGGSLVGHERTAVGNLNCGRAIATSYNYIMLGRMQRGKVGYSINQSAGINFANSILCTQLPMQLKVRRTDGGRGGGRGEGERGHGYAGVVYRACRMISCS